MPQNNNYKPTQTMSVSLEKPYVVHAIMTDLKGIRTKICKSGLHPDLIKSSIAFEYPKSVLSDIKIIDNRKELPRWDEKLL